MPIYTEHLQRVIAKDRLENDWTGGVDQFKEDSRFYDFKTNQEDENLLGLSYDWMRKFGDDFLHDGGLRFCFSDFSSVINVYSSNSIDKLNWVGHNSMFVWHINSPKEEVAEAEIIASLPIDKFVDPDTNEVFLSPITSRSMMVVNRERSEVKALVETFDIEESMATKLLNLVREIELSEDQEKEIEESLNDPMFGEGGVGLEEAMMILVKSLKN